ncbi:MAG: class I tRNA ligase family protein, partial [Phycisphaerae bacterium]
RPDTLFGATYMVLAPEHALVDLENLDCIVPEAWPDDLSDIPGPLLYSDPRVAVTAYQQAAARRSERERTTETKSKTGVFTGAYAWNPVYPRDDARARIPIFIADYVLTGYGTGAIMAVPAHDTRDLDFAEAFGLPTPQVIQPPAGQEWRGYTGEGVACNSPPPHVSTRQKTCDINGMPTSEAKRTINAWLESKGLGRLEVTYKLRDWLFSRQRYWGEPFPIVHGEDGGAYAVAEDELPITLPDMRDFRPQSLPEDSDDEPRPPLGRASDWVKVRVWIDAAGRAHTIRPGSDAEQKAGAEGHRVLNARREVNTMPQWAGSCWYYLRFCDPKNDAALCDPEIERYWMQPPAGDDAHPGGIDMYLGGVEHAVLHLLYARFWHKLLYDLGHVSTPEPFGRLFNQGMIRAFAYRDARGVPHGYDEIDLRDDGAFLKATGERLTAAIEKMSKTLKNVINPDDVIREYGADALRLYELFMGPLDQSKPWNPRDVPGVFRFLQRVWRLVVDADSGELNGRIVNDSAPADPLRPWDAPGRCDDALERALHRTIAKVGDDIDRMAFNTAISAMMEFVNAATAAERIHRDQLERFVLILSPFAPHIAEELWQRLRGTAWSGSMVDESWPAFEAALTIESEVELAVQVNGKMRTRVRLPRDADCRAAETAALADEKVAAAIAGKTVRKVIVVPGRLVNIVVG